MGHQIPSDLDHEVRVQDSAREYFCATVGAVDEKTVIEYVESQKWDQDDQGFKITAPEEP